MTSGCDLPNAAFSYQPSTLSYKNLHRFATERARAPAPPRILVLRLPLGLTAGQFLDLGLFRSAWIVAGLERLFGLAFLTGGAFGFLAFFFG